MVIAFCLIGLIVFVLVLIWHIFVFVLVLIWHIWEVDSIKASFRKQHAEAETYWIKKTIEHLKAINSQANNYRIQIEGLEKALEDAKARSPIPKPSPIPEPKQGDPLSGPPFIPDIPGTTPTKDGGRWVHLG